MNNVGAKVGALAGPYREVAPADDSNPVLVSGGDDRVNAASAHKQHEQSQTSLPLRADPATGALVGTVVLITLLMPSSLIFLLMALFVITIVRGWRSRREPKVDREFAARFRELESSILDTDEGR